MQRLSSCDTRTKSSNTDSQACKCLCVSPLVFLLLTGQRESCRCGRSGRIQRRSARCSLRVLAAFLAVQSLRLCLRLWLGAWLLGGVACRARLLDARTCASRRLPCPGLWRRGLGFGGLSLLFWRSGVRMGRRGGDLMFFLMMVEVDETRSRHIRKSSVHKPPPQTQFKNIKKKIKTIRKRSTHCKSSLNNPYVSPKSPTSTSLKNPKYKTKNLEKAVQATPSLVSSPSITLTAPTILRSSASSLPLGKCCRSSLMMVR